MNRKDDENIYRLEFTAKELAQIIKCMAGQYSDMDEYIMAEVKKQVIEEIDVVGE